MKKQDKPSLREKVAVMIIKGEVSDHDVELLSKGKPLPSANRVLKSYDIMVDGSFRKHEVTDEEVISFVSKHRSYEELMVAIKDARDKYSKRAERAKKARENVGKNSESKCDNSSPLSGDGIANVADQTSGSAMTDQG